MAAEDELRELVEQIKVQLRREGARRMFSPVVQAAVARAEESLELQIPELLRRYYTEVANGGFGPGLGVLGLEGGYSGDYGNLVGNIIDSWPSFHN